MPITTKRKRGVSKQAAFLAAFRRTASVTLAAKAAKIERQLHYRWLAEDAYRADFEAAKEEAAQTLEDEAIRRAHEGHAEPLVYQGGFCYKQRKNKDTGKLEYYGAPLAVRKYSDPLMMFLLRGFRPDKYRDRGSVELSGPAGGPIALADKRFELLSDDELAGLINTARKLQEVA